MPGPPRFSTRRFLTRRFSLGLFARPSRQVASAAVAIAVATLMLFAHSQWQAYDLSLTRAERDTRNAAYLLAEHAARTFDGIHETLRAVARLRADAAKGIYRSQASLHVNLKTLRGGSQILRDVGWYDAYGELVATSRTLDPPRISVAREETFLGPRAQATQALHVSPPRRASAEAPWRIDVSLRLEGPDGAFAGIAAGTLDPGEFARVYRSLDMGPGGRTTLYRHDGIVLARAPHLAPPLAASGADSALFREHLPRAPFGTYHAPAPFDGTEEIA
ncbi:MAG: hypothetical protein WD100_09570, partial [Tistlia sp.]